MGAAAMSEPGTARKWTWMADPQTDNCVLVVHDGKMFGHAFATQPRQEIERRILEHNRAANVALGIVDRNGVVIAPHERRIPSPVDLSDAKWHEGEAADLRKQIASMPLPDVDVDAVVLHTPISSETEIAAIACRLLVEHRGSPR